MVVFYIHVYFGTYRRNVVYCKVTMMCENEVPIMLLLMIDFISLPFKYLAKVQVQGYLKKKKKRFKFFYLTVFTLVFASNNDTQLDYVYLQCFTVCNGAVKTIDRI